MGVGERQAEDRDVIEIVARLANDLADPRKSIVAVGAQQRQEAAGFQEMASSRTVMRWR